MGFNPTRIICSPEALPDGHYYATDILRFLIDYAESGSNPYTVKDNVLINRNGFESSIGSFKYFYPCDDNAPHPQSLEGAILKEYLDINSLEVRDGEIYATLRAEVRPVTIHLSFEGGDPS